MECRNSEMPCKMRKRRFPTASSSSFANNNISSQLLVEKTPSHSHSPTNEKLLHRSNCKQEEEESMRKSETEVIDKSVRNVDRSRNKSRTSSAHLPPPEVIINPRYKEDTCSFTEKDKSFGGIMHSIFDAKLFEEKSRPFGETETEIKNHRHLVVKPTHGLNEIKQSLTISRELLKLLTHVWTVGSNHAHNSMSISLASTLNHELNKARSHVNKLIKEQRSHNKTSSESKEQDKIRVAVKTIARELEIEKKLRRQAERMNKKLGRELANTKSSLLKVVEKSETEKRATENLEQLCEKMAHKIEESRAELGELKRESERVREEMEEEREMLRVADILREERVHMKLSDAKYEYEDRHAQVNMIARDLEELLEADNNTNHLKKMPRVLSWYKSRVNDNGEDINTMRDESTSLMRYKNNESEVVNDRIAPEENFLWHENKGEVVNDKNSLGVKVRGVPWCENNVNQVEVYRNIICENKDEVINDENTLGEKTRGVTWYENDLDQVEIYRNIIREESTSRLHEVIKRYNSDCIELEFGLGTKNDESEELNGCLEEEEVLDSYDMKEYEDEMERYKMIKDLRDRIVSGSDLSRDTFEFGSSTT